MLQYPTPVRRSTMIMPVNVDRFVSNVWRRDCDAVVLDLEDSVTPAQKPHARTMMQGQIAVAGRGGSEVWVRINHDTVEEDCSACVWPGLTGIFFPKAESKEDLVNLDRILDHLERERGLPPGAIEVAPAIETVKGIWNSYDIAGASPRVRGMGGVADGDLAGDIGITMEGLWEVDIHAYGRGEADLACRAHGGEVQGKVWAPGKSTIADYGDIDDLYESNRVSWRGGYLGNTGIHPNQMNVFNEVYVPSERELAAAQGIIRAYQEADSRGEALAEYDGRVVDERVVAAAREMVRFSQACASRDQEKLRARSLVEASQG